MYKKLNDEGAIDVIIFVILVIVLIIGGYVAYTILGRESVDEYAPQETTQNEKVENDSSLGDFNYSEYLASVETSKDDIEELYFGSVSQFEYERDEIFGSCASEEVKEGYSEAEANEICICTLDLGIEQMGGIVKFTYNLRNGSPEGYTYSEHRESCIASI